jgi:hypothetical protein
MQAIAFVAGRCRFPGWASSLVSGFRNRWMRQLKALLDDRRLILSAGIALLLTACPLRAVEKYWIAHEAQLIVVGTYRPGFTFPWFDGWHLTGTIDIDEVLYGPSLTGRLNYRFVSKWDCTRPYWPPPRLDGIYTQKGIWFFRLTGRGTWIVANACSESGFRFLSQRADFENYIRLYKR